MTNKGFRTLIVDVDGIKRNVVVPANISIERANILLKVCRAYLFQYVYTEIIISQIFMLVIEDDVKNKPIFKHRVKKRWNESVQAIKKIISIYNEHFSDNDFCYEFAATFYDNISSDIYKLRDLLAQKMNNIGIKSAGLYANVILLYNLVTLSVKTHDLILRNLKERYGINLSNIYGKYRNTDTDVKSYDLLCAVLGKDYKIVAPLLVGKEMRACYERIEKGIFSSANLEEATKNGLECSPLKNEERVGNYYTEEEIMKGNI